MASGDPTAIPAFSPDELDKQIAAKPIERCDELIRDITEFRKENKFWARVWFTIYLLVGLMAVVSSSVSAILTFLSVKKTLLFTTAFLSTASAYILTFLNPSGQMEKHRQAVVRSSALLEKVKSTKLFIGLDPNLNPLEKLGYFTDDYASLMEDSLR